MGEQSAALEAIRHGKRLLVRANGEGFEIDPPEPRALTAARNCVMHFRAG